MRALVRFTVGLVLFLICLAVVMQFLAIALPNLMRSRSPEVYREVIDGYSLPLVAEANYLDLPQDITAVLIVAGISVIVTLLVLGGLGYTVVLVVRALKKEPAQGRKRADMDAQEAGLIQEIYRGLAGLEKRVETLETILLETKRPAQF
jgi:hypothetical protein